MTASSGIDRKALALALALGAGLFAGAAPAQAQDEPGWLTKALGLRTETPTSPAFVQKTRPATSDYVPVHTPRVGPASKPMSREQVIAQEKSLDASRRSHDRVAGRAGVKVEKSVADGAVDSKPRAQKPEPCVGLTCANPSLLPAQSGREYR